MTRKIWKDPIPLKKPGKKRTYAAYVDSKKNETVDPKILAELERIEKLKEKDDV